VPELPEVETVVRELRPLLQGCRIADVAVSDFPLRRRWQGGWDDALIRRRVQAIRRRGKWIIIELEDEGFLVIHLGMTGQLTVVESKLPQAEHTHLVMKLDRGKHELRFRDVRRFGSATVFADPQALDVFFQQTGLGPEPFDVDPAYWRECLAGTKRCLKAVLLDQSIVAGVGNIYADESLFESRLHPTRLGCEITRKQAETLRLAVAAVLTRAIEKRGSSIRDYIGGNGTKGGFQKEFCVYGRTGEKCVRCPALIECIRLAGRSTHFCPRCQKSGQRLAFSGQP